MARWDPIAYMESDFKEKFGIPRQSGLVNSLKSRVVFYEGYNDPNALKGLEEYSHIWLLWLFSRTQRENWSPTVRPPKLGGETRMGVFATRSPFRPNPIGLSCVKLEKVEKDAKRGMVLVVSGADLMDGTPILDIKPYLPYTDCHPEATSGFAGRIKPMQMRVECPEQYLLLLPEDSREAAIDMLRQDPRPGYQQDPERVYGISFAGVDIRFRVDQNVLYVLQVVPKETQDGQPKEARDG